MMRAGSFWWGVTIALYLLQNAITAVFTCCGDNEAQASSTYKVVKKVCSQGWKSVDTSSPGSLREGSPNLSHSWGQQTLCLKVHHNAATWSEARDSCRQQHASLIDLDYPGFISQNLVTVMQNLARELWSEGLKTSWTGMFIKTDKLWWDHPAPRPIYGPDSNSWWEWLAGQPSQRTGSYGRLDLKNGTSTGATPPGSDGSIFVPHPTSVFRLGMSLAPGSTKLPYACINNGFELPPTQGSKCPPGWYGSPYIDKCLWHSNKHLATYKEARNLCKDKGAELAMPKDSFYNAYVTKVILNAELGLLHADDPDPEELNSEQSPGEGRFEVAGGGGGGGSSPGTMSQCVICNNAHSIDKCLPAPELNGSCQPDKTCGLRITKMSNGTILYSGGCFRQSECIFGDRISAITLQDNLCSVEEASYTLCCSTSRCLQQYTAAMTDFTCTPEFPMPSEGTADVPGENTELECFTCEGVTSDEECISRGSVVRCDREYPSMKSPVCLTQVWQESRHSRIKITKHCSRAVDCQGARQDCTPLSVSPRCIYCCQGNRCNQWLPDNPIDRSSLVRRTWIGFQKKASLLNWEDGRVTKVSTWNNSFGSVYPYLPETGCGQLWADRPWGNEWLVGDCVAYLPYVCEIGVQNQDGNGVKILVHPKDVNLHLGYPKDDDVVGSAGTPLDPGDTSGHGGTISLSCEAINYHPDLPVVWVKDGRYYDNGVPPAGFYLDVTMEKLSDIGAHGGSIHGLQGEYHCEVWDSRGSSRVRSKSATVKFEDVQTFQGTIRLPNHVYNATVHSRATLLFSPNNRIGLEYYQHMIHSLTSFACESVDFHHQVIIKSYRHGSLVIDFTVFYELPTSDVTRMLQILGVDINQKSGHFLEAKFMEGLEREIDKRLIDNSTSWNRQYSALNIGPEDIILRGTSACAEQVTTWEGRRIVWPSTPIGETGHSKHKCLDLEGSKPLGTRQCLGDFYSGAYFGEPTYISTCSELTSPVTLQLRALSEMKVTPGNADSIVGQLTSLVSDIHTLISNDVVYIAYILENLAMTRDVKAESLRALIKISSDLSTLNQTIIYEANTLDPSCSRLMLWLEQIGKRASLPEETSSTFVDSNLIMSIHDVDNQSAVVVQGFGYAGDSGSFVQNGVRWFDSGHDMAPADIVLGITLPRQLTDRIGHQKDLSSSGSNARQRGRVVFTLYRKTDFFEPLNPDSAYIKHKSCGTAVAASVRGNHYVELEEPVLTIFTLHEEIVPSDVQCVFWNYSAHSGGGDWSKTGCHVNRTQGNTVVCSCNHLTTFSLLLKPAHTLPPQGQGDITISLVLLVGLCVSIAGLGLTVIAFIIFRKLRRNRGQKILFHIALSVLLADIVMWVGIDRLPSSTSSSTTSGALCVGTAALLHYLLLVAFTWVLTEAILGFLLALHGAAAAGGKRHIILKASILAWGIPAIIVGIICGADYTLYQTNSDFCWLNGISLHLGFVLPYGLILLAGVTLSATVLCQIMSCHTKFSLKTCDVTSPLSPGHFITNILTTVLLGVSWITCYFSWEYYHTYVLELIFSVTNGLFGVYIFVIFLFREPTFRENWRDCCPCARRKSESSPASSVGTISSKLAPTLQKVPESSSPGQGNIYVIYPAEATTLPF